MQHIKNFLSKREQSQARLRFAECEKSRLKAKLMMTLALLLTAVTGAWAESKPIGLNVEYAAGDEITSTTDVYVYYGEQSGTLKKMGVKITSTQPLKISEIIHDYIVLNGGAAVYYLSDGVATGGNAGGISCFGESTGDATVVHVASGSGTLADPYVFAPGPFGTPVDLTRGTGDKINEWTLTNGMPAGNVTVNVKYFAQAEFAMSTGTTPVALAPAAIANVPATTDGAIVEAGTVANIGTTDDKQGTLMYFVSQPTGNTIPDAPDYDTEGWSEDVPTANGLQEGKAYVWYYIKGAEPTSGDRTDDNTRSDSDIKALGTTGFVTLLPEPTYTVEFAKGTNPEAPAEPIWTASPNADVKKGQTVTVTYSGTKRVKSVKAVKKGGAASEKAYYSGSGYYTVDGGSGGNTNEQHGNLVDNNESTKWCQDKPAGGWYIEFHTASAIQVNGYMLRTGDDTGQWDHWKRNPTDWVLKGKKNSGDSWTVIDTKIEYTEMPNADNTEKNFDVDVPGEYQYFRLEISNNRGNGGAMQLSEMRLFK